MSKIFSTIALSFKKVVTFFLKTLPYAIILEGEIKKLVLISSFVTTRNTTHDILGLRVTNVTISKKSICDFQK